MPSAFVKQGPWLIRPVLSGRGASVLSLWLQIPIKTAWIGGCKPFPTHIQLLKPLKKWKMTALTKVHSRDFAVESEELWAFKSTQAFGSIQQFDLFRPFGDTIFSATQGADPDGAIALSDCKAHKQKVECTDTFAERSTLDL